METARASIRSSRELYCRSYESLLYGLKGLLDNCQTLPIGTNAAIGEVRVVDRDE